MLLPEDDLQLAALSEEPAPRHRRGRADAPRRRSARASLWRALRDADDLSFAPRPRKAPPLARHGRPGHAVPLLRHGARAGRRTPRLPRAARRRGRRRARRVPEPGARLRERSSRRRCRASLRFVRANESDIKREAEEAATGVRVMTVHGAKGLEADVVFLADTGGAAVVPQLRKPLVDIGRDRDDPAFLWRRNAGGGARAAAAGGRRARTRDGERISAPALCRDDARARRALRRRRQAAQARRRARWYTIVARRACAGGCRARRGRRARRAVPLAARAAPAARAEAAEIRLPKRTPAELPAWLIDGRRRRRRPRRSRFVRRAALAEPDPLPRRPADGALPGDAARLRGRLVHRLLEVLPRVPDRSARGAPRSAFSPASSRDPALADALRREAEAVLAAPELAGILRRRRAAPRWRSSASFETETGRYAVSGRIDRLARDARGWHLVDFKTDRHVPAAAAEVDPAYVLQLALYRRLLMEMEPGVAGFRDPGLHRRRRRASRSVMPIPAEMMEQALGRARNPRQSGSLTGPGRLPTFRVNEFPPGDQHDRPP